MLRIGVAVVVGAGVASALTGCISALVGERLEEAEGRVLDGEGEGEEGEGEEGEGEEGEGEGEGPIVDEDDPACEAEERLLVVRDDSVDALQVYDLDDGGIRRRRPEGQAGNVNLDNEDATAQQNGYGAEHVAVGSNDRLYVVGDRFLYEFRSSSLQQRTITGRTQLTLESFGSVGHIEMLNDQILTIGPDIKVLAEGAPVATNPTILHDTDTYLSSTSFSFGDTRYVGVSAEHGFVVVGSVDGGAPQVVSFVDTEFDTARIHQFFNTPKGIAFDNATASLLLGDHGRVIVLKAPNFIYEEDADEGDWVLPGDTSGIDVAAIAARGGFAWVVLRRSTDNLIKLDLSTSPPTAVLVETIDTGGFGRHIAVGCKRVFVTAPSKVIAVRRDDLGPAGTLAVNDLERIRIVGRTALGIAGDD